MCPLYFAKLLPFVTQIGGQYCWKDFGFVSFSFSISILFILWKSVGFNNSRSTHDCHKRPVPVVKFESFMIVTSVIYLLEKHKLWHNSIPFTIVRSNLCPSRNRRVPHTSARLWLSQAACTRRKRLDSALFRSIYDCHILPVSVGKCRIMCISSVSRLSYYWEACVHREITGFAHFDSITIDIGDHAVWEAGIWS